MSSYGFPLRWITRCTIELTAPCTIGTGQHDDYTADMPFALDANGLPMIPATSMAGLLRAFVQQHKGEAEAQRWFGHQRPGKASAKHDNGTSSRVWIEHGHIHDKDDVAVHRQLPSKQWSSFLAALARGQIRDHVRINHRGTSDEDNRGKYDAQVLYEGTRFSFVIEVTAQETQQSQAQQLHELLLQALNLPQVRLGGRIHSGLGAFKLVRARGLALDLRKPEDFKAYCGFPKSLEAPLYAPSYQVAAPALLQEPERVTISLSAHDFFGAGGGSGAPKMQGHDKAPDLQLMRARRVTWRKDKGALSTPSPILPGAAIKGALAHRVAFHDNRLRRRFGDDALVGEENPSVQALFGMCRGEGYGDHAKQGSISGCVLIDDVWLDKFKPRAMMHTSIDHFTQGVRQNMLFSEEVLAASDEPLRFSLSIERPDELDPIAREALRLTLDDLCAGRVTLGAGYGRGHGHFNGTYQGLRAGEQEHV